ncbi:MAG: hypothetical protein P1V81_04095 [Planctomycetota bacterium]|nr:hypothetical protein [Planctomycetota bacterium]
MSTMLKLLLLASPLAIAAALPGPAPVGALLADQPLAEYFPASTVAYVEAPAAGALFDREAFDQLLDAAEVRGILDSATRGRIQGGILLATLFAGGDPFELAGHLAHDGVALGVAPAKGWGRSKPSWGLVLRGDDPAVLEAALDRAFAELEQRFDAVGQLGQPHATERGVDLWMLGEDLALGRHGATLFAASGRGFLDELLARAAEGGESLATRPGFDLPAGDVALWLDRMGTAGLGGDNAKLAMLGEAVHLPQVQFLLGAGMAELAGASTFGFGLDLSPTGVALELIGHSPEERTGLAPSAPGPAPRLDSAASMGGATLHRDLAAIVDRRNELFAPELQPKFNKALGDLALLFGGMEIDEDLLPAIGPWIELGVAELDFTGLPAPDLPLPGLVAIFEVDPTRERNLIAGFQTAVSISNTERAQNGEPPFTLLLGLEGETTVSSGHLPLPADGEPVDTDYNLAPACAFRDGVLVLGTHEAIVRAALRDLARHEVEATTTAAIFERVHLSGPPLAALVDSSREYLVMQAILEDGKTREEAVTETLLLRTILASLESATLELDHRGDDLVLGLDLRLIEAIGAPTTEPR